MKKLLANVWKTKTSIFYLVLYVAILFSNFIEFRFSNNVVSDVFITMGVGYSASMYWSTLLLSPLFMLIFVNILIRAYYYLFGFIYARSFAGKISIVTELPIGRRDFPKFIILFAIITNIAVGILRLFILIDYNLYFLINNVFKPLVTLGIAILAYFTLKKYILEGRVAYNSFLALSIPYLFYFFLFV